MEITLDPAFYTLIGALGGIFITQVANYFLEDKKAKNSLNIKNAELGHQRHYDLLKERRIAYSNFLEAIDKSQVTEPHDLTPCVGPLYAALIVASEDTVTKINAVFTMVVNCDFEAKDFLKAKKELLKSMQFELQH